MCWCCLLVVLSLTGCPRTSPRSGEPTAKSTAAGRELAEVLRHYAICADYQDMSTIELTYDTPHGSVTERSRVHLSFARPNRLRFVVERDDHRLSAICDGEHVFVHVEDAASGNLQQQVVKRFAPPKMDAAELYAATELLDPAQPQQMVSLLLSLPLHLSSTQLGWLASDEAARHLERQAIRALPDANEAATTCQRFEVPTDAGPMVYWVDRQSRWIKRVDYPTGALFSQAAADERPQHLSLTMRIEPRGKSADDQNREIDPRDFTFSIADSVTWMQYFVLPPRPNVHALMGQAVAPMSFLTLRGQSERSADWRGQIVVLAWVDDQTASRRLLPMIDDLAARYERHKDIVFRAIDVASVANDASKDADSELAARRQRDEIALVTLRDTTAAGRDALQIEAVPTLVVLNAEGQLEWFQVGADPQIDQQLDVILRQLIAGGSVARDVHQAERTERERFEQQLRLARLPDSAAPPTASSDPATPSNELASVAAQHDFERWPQETMWQSDEMTGLGQLSWVPRRGAAAGHVVAHLPVHDLLPIEADGTLGTRRTLDADDSITQFSQATQPNGQRYFVGWASLSRQVSVFDEQFERLLTYPPAEAVPASPTANEPHVQDAQLYDVNADGQLELLMAYDGQAGCECVDLRGHVLWHNRMFPNVTSLVVQRFAEPVHLLASGAQGLLLPIDLQGQAGAPLSVGRRTIHQLTAADGKDVRPAQLLGLSYSVGGQWVAVGLDEKLVEQWSYGLPAGQYRDPLRVAQWCAGDLSRDGYWLLVGPDGTLHVISDDGRLHDQCAFGAPITGIAAQADPAGLIVYVACRDRVTAYRVRIR